MFLILNSNHSTTTVFSPTGETFSNTIFHNNSYHSKSHKINHHLNPIASTEPNKALCNIFQPALDLSKVYPYQIVKKY